MRWVEMPGWFQAVTAIVLGIKTVFALFLAYFAWRIGRLGA